MTVHEKIEQASNGRQVQLLRNRRKRESVKVLTDIARRDLMQCQSTGLTPREELLRRMAVGSSGVRVPQRTVEELFPGELSRIPRIADQRGSDNAAALGRDISKS